MIRVLLIILAFMNQAVADPALEDLGRFRGILPVAVEDKASPADGVLETMQFLIEKGADVNAQLGSDGLMDHAIYNHTAETVRFLINFGALVDHGALSLASFDVNTYLTNVKTHMKYAKDFGTYKEHLNWGLRALSSPKPFPEFPTHAVQYGMLETLMGHRFGISLKNIAVGEDLTLILRAIIAAKDVTGDALDGIWIRTKNEKTLVPEIAAHRTIVRILHEFAKHLQAKKPWESAVKDTANAMTNTTSPIFKGVSGEARVKQVYDAIKKYGANIYRMLTAVPAAP